MTFHTPVIETERLRLREPRFENFEAEVAFFASERSQFVGGPLPRHQVWSTITGLIGHWALRGYGFFGVEDKVTGEYYGRVGPWFPEGWPEPEIGWSLMANGEGRGLAHEAALAARKFAYETLGWTTAISLILPGNTRSIRLAERLGAVFEGDYTHPKFGEVPIYRHPSPEALT